MGLDAPTDVVRLTRRRNRFIPGDMISESPFPNKRANRTRMSENILHSLDNFKRDCPQKGCAVARM